METEYIVESVDIQSLSKFYPILLVSMSDAVYLRKPNIIDPTIDARTPNRNPIINPL